MEKDGLTENEIGSSEWKRAFRLKYKHSQKDELKQLEKMDRKKNKRLGLSVSTFDNNGNGNRFDRPNTARFFDFDFDPELFDLYDGMDDKSEIAIPEFTPFPDFDTPFDEGLQAPDFFYEINDDSSGSTNEDAEAEPEPLDAPTEADEPIVPILSIISSKLTPSTGVLP